MSLFSTHDWWSTQCEGKFKERNDADQEEEVDFHVGCLHITDLIQNGFHIVIVGNNSGKLWAYKPTSVSSPQDLLFEYSFTKPILAFESGYFLLGSPEKHLAVLHPNQVAIYSLQESFGNTTHGQQFHLQPAYSISFQFIAYSIVIGAFGSRVKNSTEKEGKDKSGLIKNVQDAICVQAIDGSLHFFENDVNFSCVSTKTEHGGLPDKKEKLSKHQSKETIPAKSEKKTHNIRAEVHGYPTENYHTRNKTPLTNNAKTDVVNFGSPPEMSKTSPEEEVEESFQQISLEETVKDEDAMQLLKAKFTLAPLEDTNLPTLLCYLSSEDSFVVFSGSWTIDCYRYATLLMQQITSRRKKLNLPEWSYIFGEPICSLCCLQGNIFALGIRGTLVGLNSFGVQKFCKKLCFSPSALCPYSTDDQLRLLVASEEGTLMLYDGGPNIPGYADSHFGSQQSPCSTSTPKLIWSAKLPFTPVAMARANFEELSGVIVLLAADGHLQCCHLGTTPKNFMSVPSSRSQYKDDKEVEDKIMEPVSKQTSSLSLSASKGGGELSLEYFINGIQLLPVFEEAGEVGGQNYNNEEHISVWKTLLQVDISLILIPMIPLNNVCLSASIDTPLKALLGKNFIERLYEETMVALVVTANYDDTILHDAIPSLTVEVAVSCFGGCSGIGEELSLMVFHTSATLPLTAVFSQNVFHAREETEGNKAACEPILPLKTFDFSFHGYKCPTVGLLFPEFLFSQSNTSFSSSELFLFGHADKRVQLIRKCQEDTNCEEDAKECVFSVASYCMLPLYYVACMLNQRLEYYVADLGHQIAGNAGRQRGCFFQVTPKNFIPMEELTEAIDAHTSARKNVAELHRKLGFLMNQLHMVECCILSRVKDATPKPLELSEILLEPILEKVFNGINKLSDSQQELDFISKKLRIVLQLVMQLQPELSSHPAFKTFGNAISLVMVDTLNQGWEERSIANLACALHGQRNSNLQHFSDHLAQTAEADLSAFSTENLKRDVVQFLNKFTNNMSK